MWGADPAGEASASPLAPEVIHPAVAALAALYGLGPNRLGRLAAFASSHPELPAEFSAAVHRHVKQLAPDHPSRSVFDVLPADRMAFLAEILVRGRLDRDYLDYVDSRMRHYDNAGTEPRWMHPWAIIFPDLIAELAEADGLPSAEKADLVATADRVCLLTMVVMTHVFITSRDLRLIDAQVNERFRSLVESVDDVITVVAGEDTVTVMSPTARALDALSGGNPFPTMTDLLSVDDHARWRAADDRVQTSGRAATMKIETTDPGGGVVTFEARGTMLAGGNGERVWAWRDVSQKAELERQLSHQAYHDPLTGLANRTLLLDRIERALSRIGGTAPSVSLLFCDLDDFKSVNDSLGHAQGDELLRVVTARLQGCVRASDTLARLGGDEFAVLIDGADEAVATAVAERIVSVVPHQIRLAGRSLFPSVSVGLATAQLGTTTEELLRNADLAMYEAKRSGRGRLEVYSDRLQGATSARLDLIGDLKRGLGAGEFVVHYQPSYDLVSGRVDALEALVRWQHPTRGLIAPDEFLALAEASGAIVGIGAWVIAEACRVGASIQGVRPETTPMHVNLSPGQLRDPAIVDVVERALAGGGLPADLLVLDVAEGVLVDDRLAVERLAELRSLGVRLALDDFGTGYTSVTRLGQLPIDVVKIDRTLVAGDSTEPAKRRAMLEAIVGLTTNLGLRSVAEGVETEDERAELAALGCNAGQGYRWSPAVPATDLPRLLVEASAAADTDPGGPA